MHSLPHKAGNLEEIISEVKKISNLYNYFKPHTFPQKNPSKPSNDPKLKEEIEKTKHDL